MAHAYFVVQADGIVLVSDGSTQATFPTLAAFREAEPGQLLVPGIVAVNFERRGDLVLAVSTFDDGNTSPIPEEDWPAYDAMIAKAAVYAQVAEAQARPLHGVNEVITARAIVTGLVVNELERRSSAAFSLWPNHERNTFEQQLAEAEAYLADPQATTPLLDAIRLPEETMAELAQAIVGHSAAFKLAMGVLMGAKRRHLAAISAADLDALRAYDVTAGWPG